MTCRVAATFDLPSPRPFVHHLLDFSQPTPMGFARCRVCGDHVTKEQWSAWPCTGAPSEATFAPVSSSEVACALCGDPLHVDPAHRATVEFFGSTCSDCFNQEAAHV